MIAFGSATAQDQYPSRPIRLVLPYPAGGSYDAMGRLIGDQIAKRLGQPIVIDNKPGGGGEIGTTAAATAPADGYTLALFGNSQAIRPTINPSNRFDIQKSFEPIARFATVAEVIVINPTVSANTLGEFVELARAKPGQLNFGSGGAGGITHLAGELLKARANVDLVHIPYKGQAPAVTGLIANEVQMLVLNVVSAIPQVKAGKMRALAVTIPTRSPFLPDVPTVEEAGVSGYELVEWYGLLAPKGTPKEVIDKVHAAVEDALKQTDVKDALSKLGAAPLVGDTPEGFRKFIDSEISKYAEIIKNAGIKLER
jgi:tripartite-type tricarboxylate transporter receptor subunit TctC